MKKIISLFILVSISLSSVFAVSFKTSAFYLNDNIVFEGIEKTNNSVSLANPIKTKFFPNTNRNVWINKNQPSSTTEVKEDNISFANFMEFIGLFFGLTQSIYNPYYKPAIGELQRDNVGRIHNKAEDNLFRD